MMKKLIVCVFALSALAAAPESGAVPASEAVCSLTSMRKPVTTGTVVFKTHLHCQKCVNKIMENISFEKGVKDLKVSLEEQTITIVFDSSKTDASILAKAIEALGYPVETVK